MKLALGLAVLGIGVSDQPNGAPPLAQKVPGSASPAPTTPVFRN